ncbi:ankyrin repeat-containing domain protein [Syncephalastrum racemosum]|uniref:Ankyrin repeat-containing domain protein n=1 Tax=Syncephalastrum racemosum TaxID=13706 RepID=A0A1X2HMG5_SYNRA|nr:ankyrin repeat-containing domain protein [Syncephalastrum racemosum]
MADFFEDASKFMSMIEAPLNNDKKLKLYALYKQATIGNCDASKPNLFEFVARAKWDAWNALQGMPQEQAQLEYIEFVESLGLGWTRQGLTEPTIQLDQEEEGNGMGNVVSSMMVQEDDEEEEDDVYAWARQNNLEKVKQAADIAAKDEDGLTALHYAADRGHTDLVKLLLDRGADINALTPDNETPFYYACISEQLAVAQLLMDRGCDTSIRDVNGETALDQADASFVKCLQKYQ